MVKEEEKTWNGRLVKKRKRRRRRSKRREPYDGLSVGKSEIALIMTVDPNHETHACMDGTQRSIISWSLLPFPVLSFYFEPLDLPSSRGVASCLRVGARGSYRRGNTKAGPRTAALHHNAAS